MSQAVLPVWQLCFKKKKTKGLEKRLLSASELCHQKSIPKVSGLVEINVHDAVMGWIDLLNGAYRLYRRRLLVSKICHPSWLYVIFRDFFHLLEDFFLLLLKDGAIVADVSLPVEKVPVVFSM